MTENINLKSVYGTDDDLESCPNCQGTLRTDVMNTQVDNQPAKNWYCGNCEYAFVKGLRNPKFQK